MRPGPKPNRFLGKYRATVVDNVDPEQRGRILATVPDVQGLVPMSWALPCVPMAGKLQGMFHVPQVGSGVWIEFEQGDPNYPIWVGGFWGSFAEVPASALIPPPLPLGDNIVIQTTLGHTVSISDAAPMVPQIPIPHPAPVGTGGITLRCPTGAFITVNDAGIFINNGKGASIKLIGPGVIVNETVPGLAALLVT